MSARCAGVHSAGRGSGNSLQANNPTTAVRVHPAIRIRVIAGIPESLILCPERW